MVVIKIKGTIVSNEDAQIYRKWLGMDVACPGDIEKGLAQAAGEEVTVEINSPGGACVYGSEMNKLLMEYTGKVTAHIISAISAATIVACAADEVLIADAGIYMIHNPSSAARGDYRDMYAAGGMLTQFGEGIINVYMRKTGRTHDEIKNLMDASEWMGPEKAIKFGFVDGYIFGDPKREENRNNLQDVVALAAPIIPDAKMRELKLALMRVAPVQLENEVPDVTVDTKNGGIGQVADLNTNSRGGETMDLKEFLTQNPNAAAELEKKLKDARDEATVAERERIRSLDAIAGTVAKETLEDAKYGEKPQDGPTLAYHAMLSGNKLAQVYMQNAMEDATDSKADNVGTGELQPEDGESGENVADALAAHVNNTKGGGK